MASIHLETKNPSFSYSLDFFVSFLCQDKNESPAGEAKIGQKPMSEIEMAITKDGQRIHVLLTGLVDE